MQFVTIGAQGKVTIPARLREKFGLTSGTFMEWSVEDGKLALNPSVKVEARKQFRRRVKGTA